MECHKGDIIKMQLDLFLVIFLGIKSIIDGVIIYLLLRKKNIQTDYISKRQKPFTEEDMAIAFQKINQAEQANPNAEKLSKRDDVISHEGVGIVYRPTAEEIEKMNEPKQTREAKEAIAVTLRKQNEIDKENL